MTQVLKSQTRVNPNVQSMITDFRSFCLPTAATSSRKYAVRRRNHPKVTEVTSNMLSADELFISTQICCVEGRLDGRH